MNFGAIEGDLFGTPTEAIPSNSALVAIAAIEKVQPAVAAVSIR